MLNPNIWYLDSVTVLTDFLARGGRAVLVAEEIDPYLREHPLCLRASILLPPYEAVSMDIDGNTTGAFDMYSDYLRSEEPDTYIVAIAASIIQGIPIGIYFGTDEMEKKFAVAFMSYLFDFYGISVGLSNAFPPIIPTMRQEYLPVLLAKLYMLNLIDYKTVMEDHPNVPFAVPEMITKMAFEINPLVKEQTFKDYQEYFEMVKTIIKQNGDRFLVDPVERTRR